MQLLKFKSNDKKEDVEKESSEVPVENSALDHENTEVPIQRPLKVGKDGKKDTNDLNVENKTYRETELYIPSSQELISVFEELVAYIYQLEYDRGA